MFLLESLNDKVRSNFQPAQTAFALTFVVKGEHDQAISPYSTTAQPFKGNHLPRPFQCSQRGSPSVLSQDEDGRLFVVPSRPPAKLPDDSERRKSGPTVPHHYINPCNVSVRQFDSCARICFETKRQELGLHGMVSPIRTSSLTRV